MVNNILEAPVLHIDFAQAKTKHLLFKNNLRSILYGFTINKQPLISEYECGLGKWIYGHALTHYGHLAEMHELEKVHIAIHECARELIAKYEAGLVEEARDGLGRMEMIADQLMMLLDDIELKITTTSGVDIEADKHLNINYTDLQELHETINKLDQRIKEQTIISTEARKLAEANENKFRNTVMQAPVGMVILRGEDMFVEMANDTYLQIINQTRESYVGRSAYETMPEIKALLSPILTNVLKTGEPFHGNEFEVTFTRNGRPETGFFNFVYSPLIEPDKTISGIIVVATEITAQVKSKMAIKLKDAQFRNLVSQSPVAMAIIKGEDFVVELANKTMLNNLWRREFADVEGKKLLTIFPELGNQKYPDLIKSVLQTGVPIRESEAVITICSEDGAREYFIDYEFSPLDDFDGSRSSIMITANDVTEKVMARKTIEIAQQKYRSLIETLPVAVYTIDADGYIDLYNQAAVNLWQRTPVKGVDSWCGSHGLYTLDKVFVPHDECPMSIALKENKSITTEAYVQRPDGELRHIIAHPQPIHSQSGAVIGAMNVQIDITERIEAEKALVSSEQKFRLLANSMPQFIWTATPEGSLNYFSQSVFDYSGFTEEQIFTQGWLEIVHPNDREANVTTWLQSIATGEHFHFEHRFKRNDGEYRWQLSRAVPQKDAAGNIQMWVGTSTDIHDRRLFLDELTVKVEERTKELTITNENLLKSNAELAQFAYVASHDLQEPLRKIQTFISRIIELDYNNLSDRGKDYFNRIEVSSNRTRLLIQDLLTFSRTTSAQSKLIRTDLNELLTKLKNDISDLTQNNQVIISSTTLPTLQVIDFQFEQLFTNILSNAIKFSKKDTPCIIEINAAITYGSQINAPNVNAETKYHHISFSDNGIGFEQQFNERIFLVFQRLHSKESYEGTGIGLAICKKIVENHHGVITATGMPGQGAIFNIYIPYECYTPVT